MSRRNILHDHCFSGVLKNTPVGRLFKNAPMQGAQKSKREAYLWKYVERGALQRSAAEVRLSRSCQEAGTFLQPGGEISRTGMEVWRVTFSATLPNRKSDIPDLPWVLITMRSTLSFVL